MAKDLRNTLERHLLTITPEDRSQNFHPSGCMACGRALVMAMLDKNKIQAEPHPPKLQMIFDTGHALHYMIQNYFIEMGACPDDEGYESYEKMLVEFCEEKFGDTRLIKDRRIHHLIRCFRWCMNPRVEVPIKQSEYNLIGHSDLIPIIGGKDVVMDIKTINARRFSMLNQKTVEYKDKIQLLLYMYCLNKAKGILFYFCKDNCESKEYIIRLEDFREIVLAKLEWFKRLKECVSIGKLPDRERDQDSKDCQNCLYYAPCWDGASRAVAASPF